MPGSIPGRVSGTVPSNAKVSIHDGETVKITAGKDGLTFNGAAAKAKAA